MSIKVLAPSRERPERALQLIESFEKTKVLDDTEIRIGIDYNDPRESTYYALIGPERIYRATTTGSGSFSKVTNEMARVFTADIFGSVGDDHRFKTKGWDNRITEALQAPGIAYANDLYMREWLPTACFISSSIVAALGWFALPLCDHLYIDNTWKDIGTGLGALTYLPDVIIEHLHYTNNKSILDHRYRQTNAPSQFKKDQAAYELWRRDFMQQDIARIKESL